MEEEERAKRLKVEFGNVKRGNKAQWLPPKRDRGLNGGLPCTIPEKLLDNHDVCLGYCASRYSQGKLSLFYSKNKISDFVPYEQ